MTVRFGEEPVAPRPPRPTRANPASLTGLLSLLVLFLLSGCQSFPPPESAQVDTEQELVVPFVPQEKYQCGPRPWP